MDQSVSTTNEQVEPAQTIPAPVPPRPLSPLAESLIKVLEKPIPAVHGKRIDVNPVVAKFASWYEKLRNVMEYREDEVMLRAAIERILKRHLLLGGNAKTTAAPLVRELIWARYLPDNEVPETVVHTVEQSIDVHLRLRLLVLQRYKLQDHKLNELIYHILSADIERILRPNREKEIIANFMFQILKEDVSIIDDSEETKNAQVYIAIRKAFARDDKAFIEYHLFRLYFGPLTEHSLHKVAEIFMEGYQEIIRELQYPRKMRIYGYIKRKTAAFLILEDILRTYNGRAKDVLQNELELERAVYNSCEEKYSTIRSKVTTAIVRSVFFILFTKVMFAFAIEGTYERIVYGHILWMQLIINTSVPPILMLFVGLFIRTPGPDNSLRVLNTIKRILYSPDSRIGEQLVIKKRKDNPGVVFTSLWFLAFIISFGAIVYVLKFLLGFNLVSVGIFLFFLAIVSFLAYRITLTAKRYSQGDRQSFFTPFVDFFFMPVIQVGQRLSSNISRLNILIFIFDFLIETPFKLLFAFFEQWFLFLHAKREELE